MWNDLTMSERADVIKMAVKAGLRDMKSIRDFYDKSLSGNSYKDGGKLSDQKYYSTMERVAEENNPIWNKDRIKEGYAPLSVDEEYTRLLNDNSYDYRGYYEKYPEASANANTHWSDEFKTAYHPSFSNESKYSGVKSKYNPLGLPGGYWVGETFIPMAWQLHANAPKYADGGPKVTLVDNDKVRMSPSGTFSDDNGNIIGDSVVLPDITIRARDDKKHVGEYKSTFNPSGAAEFAGTVLNSPLMLADKGINKLGINGTPVQTTAQRVGETLSPTRWAGTLKSGFKESPWSENNPGLWDDKNLDMMTDLLLTPKFVEGIGKTGKWGYGVARNIKHRNKHAYVTIDPIGYNDPVDRFKAYAKSILSGEDVDIDAINPADRKGAPMYVAGSFRGGEYKELMTKIARDEAWRKYLGLPSRTDIYLPNGDGTYRYNIPKISEIAGGEFQPHPTNKIVDGVSVDVADEVTGAGGGLTKSEFYETQAPYRNAQGTYDIIGKHIIEDDWDLNPFSREGDQVINKLQSLVNETADKTYNKLYDKLYSFDRPYRKITYNYLGGSALNKLRNSNGIINNKLLQKLNKKLANFEVGPVLGGKPFKMHTEIPYTKKIKSLLPDADGLYSGTPFGYSYGYEGNVPKGILDTSMFEPIGRAALSNKKAEGGSIHISPSKRGTFTAAATKHGMGVQEFASKVLANKDNYSPVMVKKANFARNFGGHKHDLGGYLFEEGGPKNTNREYKSANSWSTSNLHELLTPLSGSLMNFGKRGLLEAFYRNRGGTPEETYFLPKKIQRQEFLSRGYIEVPNDYGLVKKAVGNKDVPVYQTKKDDISREEVIPIGNIRDTWYGREEAALEHPGHYPTAIYFSPYTNEYYQKGWDLNDYGGGSGAYNNYDAFGKIRADIADAIGSPVVTTTGISNIGSLDKMMKEEETSNIATEFLKSKGLVPTKLPIKQVPSILTLSGKPLLDLKGEPVTYWEDEYVPTLPEITITGKRRKKVK